MIISACWFISSYTLCALLVHAAHYYYKDKGSPEKHIVLVTRNNQLELEWVIRSLRLFAWIRGQALRITLVDQGSQDDTVWIAEHFAGRCSEGVRFIQTKDGADAYLASLIKQPDQVIRMDLQPEGRQIPQWT